MLRNWKLALVLSVLAALAGLSGAGETASPRAAASKVTAVTVYPSNALVTRTVNVPEGIGPFELVVTPLPPHTVSGSLYSEGTEGIHVLTTRFRQRPIFEDTREEVRKLEAELKQLRRDGMKIESEIKVIDQNTMMLGKLENFTGASLMQLTEKGLLNADSIMTLAKYVMDSRAEKNAQVVKLKQDLQDNKEQVNFVERKLSQLASGSTRMERDAVIVVDKREQAAGEVKLHYLVNAASWRPQYKFRADQKKNEVQVEYLAAVMQQSGEDWTGAKLTLSTAQPMLNAAPPDLNALAVMAIHPGQPNPNPRVKAMAPRSSQTLNMEAQTKRQQAQQEIFSKKDAYASTLLNQAAALEQTCDLLNGPDQQFGGQGQTQDRDGPSVTYRLASALSIPSRQDEQVIEITRINMTPEFYYKAVPILTRQVYRLADLTNKSEYVLLPGEAMMYIGTDFVGRADLPLVAIDEQFTAGFGIDPQLQVQRTMLDKQRTTQGDNQVLTYQYRILVSSYKSEKVKVQVWDRLPFSDNESVGVSLMKAAPELSQDKLYQREEKTQNLLRWDMEIAPNTNGVKAAAIDYQFKIELGRAMTLGEFVTK
ncbi:MAG: mucoidy inhibitor MuiA family protein [Gemmataceae bacterium]